MKTQLNPKALGAIGGLLVLLAVLGAGYYLEFVKGAVERIAPEKRQYSTGVITTELTENGIFNKTIDLNPVLESSSSLLEYDTKDIGKTDISSPN